MVEINFLCVHKKLRSKRMAPVLIREITRRVNLEGIFQATYTAGVLLPKPIAACRYWHRSLNPKKLVDIQFSQMPRNMTMQRMIRLYRLPEVVHAPLGRGGVPLPCAYHSAMVDDCGPLCPATGGEDSWGAPHGGEGR